jgi:3-methylfumaryl-CoA hydratase
MSVERESAVIFLRAAEPDSSFLREVNDPTVNSVLRFWGCYEAMKLEIDITNLRKWVGKTESATDQIAPRPMAALSATLDSTNEPPQAGAAVPPLWHWLYFLEIHRQSELREDGHAKLGGFLPPVPLPRRMWAGGRLEFRRGLKVGEVYTRKSQIADVQLKQGRTGNLVFVTLHHEIANEKGTALTEEQDLVYRENAKPGDPAPKPQPAAKQSAWERTVSADDRLLFRYSALTFNGHRIHYDRRFAMETEGYPGLVIHGPLIATLLVELLRRNMPGATITSIAFRSVSPLFDVAPFVLRGKPETDGTTVSFWAAGPDDALAMTATATIG